MGRSGAGKGPGDTGYPRPVTSPQPSTEPTKAGAAASPPTYFDAFAELGYRFLGGEGMRIGGEAPAAFAAGSWDFIEDDGLFERSDDPLATIEAQLAGLKPGGVLFYTVPAAKLTELLTGVAASLEGVTIEAAGRQGDRMVVVLRKPGGWPEPAAPARTAPELAAALRQLRAHTSQVERELDTTGRELRRVKQSSSWRVTEPLRAAKARLATKR
jgi:SAM-dependent methyltransferase